MASTAVQARLTAERRFYGGMALFMIALVLIGFGPSFYLRGYMHSPRPNPTLTPMVMLHGIMFTLWMLIFWSQTMLIAANRRDLHIRMGVAGMVLAILLLPLMYETAVYQVARANQPPFATPIGWTAVPLALIPPFAIVVWQGWKQRKNGPAHKRLMLSAALMMMDPAVGRLPIVPPVLAGFAILNVLSLLTFAPLFWWDRKTLGKIHWATKLGVALFAAALVLRLPLIGSPAYAALAAHLPGM
jgi:hypothetical protein